jgi:hypothetical protein
MLASAMIALMGACAPGTVTVGDDAVDPNEPDPWSELDDSDEGERSPFGCKAHSGFSNGDRTHLTYLAVATLAEEAGVPCGKSLVTAVAVAAAESGRYQFAFHTNTGCSVDRGIWQINGYYHPTTSRYDLAINAQGMASISKHGTSWSPWWTFKKGRHLPFLASACAAVETLCGVSYC